MADPNPSSVVALICLAVVIETAVAIVAAAHWAGLL